MIPMMTNSVKASNNNNNNITNNNSNKSFVSFLSSSFSSSKKWNLIFVGFLSMTVIVCVITLLTGFIVVPGMLQDQQQGRHGIELVQHPGFKTVTEKQRSEWNKKLKRITTEQQAAAIVVVDILSKGEGPPVTKDYRYQSMVTLYIEEKDGTRTPSGWSTRNKDDTPFEFQPGINLIPGWTEGVLQMKEGERALLHVPPALGYGSKPMGKMDSSSFYIPKNSNLLFDIEILGKVKNRIATMANSTATSAKKKVEETVEKKPVSSSAAATKNEQQQQPQQSEEKNHLRHRPPQDPKESHQIDVDVAVGAGACYDITVHKCSCAPGFCTADLCHAQGEGHIWSADCPKHCQTSECEQSQSQSNVTTTTTTTTIKDTTSTTEQTAEQKYYMVFSTGCTPFQNWQALAFFYFARKVRQQGTIVRLASGCTDKQAAALQVIHQERVVPLQLHDSTIQQTFEIHITPKFGSGDGDEKYWNKPHGILHWMEESLGYKSIIHNNHNTNNTNTNTSSRQQPQQHSHKEDDAIIIILDPDMMLLRPITKNFNPETNYVGGWVDTKNTQQHQVHHDNNGMNNSESKSESETQHIVRHRHPYAQKYGYGNGWLTSLDGKLSEIVGPHSPALTLSLQEAHDYYPAGPPYVATARDMYSLARAWVKFLPGVYKLFPQMMAEMHGYSVAAAHLQLPHTLAEGFMVSDVDANGENYDFIDHNLNKANVCMRPPTFTTTTTTDGGGDTTGVVGTQQQVIIDDSYKSVGIEIKEVPYVLHYCQRYALGRYFFSKYKLREDMFDNCTAPMMKEPPLDIAEIYDWFIFPNGIETMDFAPPQVSDKNHAWKYENKRKEHLRNGWMLCVVLFGVNEAIQTYKEEKCGPPSEHPEYYQKTYHFHADANFSNSITDPSNPFSINTTHVQL